jgi:hypothetical protein
MRVTDAQVGALHAFLMHDPGATMDLTAQLGDAGVHGYLYLTHAALSVVAARRFSPRFTSADLVRYIASVRVSRIADGTEYDLDPVAAEKVLRYSLGSPGVSLPDFEARLRIIVALLEALAESELSGEAEVDALLVEARELADRWTTNDMSGPTI